MARTSVREASKATLTFAYDVVRPGDGALLVEGQTVHAATDLAGRGRRIPEAVTTALRDGGRNPQA